MHPVSFAVVDAVVFSVFAAMSIFLLVSILSPRGGFRQPDIDVLFPTPVNPRIVMFFRMFRDYLVTLLSPLLLAMFGGRLVWLSTIAFLCRIARERSGCRTNRGYRLGCLCRLRGCASDTAWDSSSIEATFKRIATSGLSITPSACCCLPPACFFSCSYVRIQVGRRSCWRRNLISMRLLASGSQRPPLGWLTGCCAK